MFQVKPILLVIIAATIAGLWKIFEKAGEKGWKALIPIYNYYIWLKIIKRPWWWILIILIPGVGFMMIMVISAITAVAFQKKKWWEMLASGVFFFVSLPYFAFSKEKFQLPLPDKKGAKASIGHEWMEAIVFAVIAATIIRTFLIEAYTIPTPSEEKTLMVGDYLFVSKASYGARIPMTPISFPFAHATLVNNINSYLEWLEFPCIRIPGYTKVQRHDAVVFNFPEGDTVCSNMDNPSYYALCRLYGKESVLRNDPIRTMDGVKYPGYLIVRPIDREENYIKRCIAIAGDTLSIRNADVYIDGKKDELPAESEFKYLIFTKEPLETSVFKKLDITDEGSTDYQQNGSQYLYEINLTKASLKELQQNPDVVNVEPEIEPANKPDPKQIFPFSAHYPWNVDNFGPLWIPKEGATVKLDTANLPLYKRIITAFEHNTLDVKGAAIYINGAAATSYTFKMNYYFMMGDNRHNSVDSRFWGFVPEDHVVGRASFVWMSIKQDVPFAQKFRIKRFFTFINPEGLSASYFLPGLLIIVLSFLYFYIKNKRLEKKNSAKPNK
ncbi:MAG TPA: signal peptidase I [Bacteroidia bacterium]|jgi:signal peptidase I|nr:signal peptidase I [Bacteroidia bacterium]